MAQIGYGIGQERIEIKTFYNGDYPLVVSARFNIYYDHSAQMIGIKPTLVADDDTKLYGSLPSGLFGDSTLTIGNRSVVLPIGQQELDYFYVWTWPINTLGFSSLFEYDSSGNGGFNYSDTINFTWAFSGFTYSGTINVLETFQEHAKETVDYGYSYNPLDFNNYNIQPSLGLDGSYASADIIEKFEIALSSNGVTPDIIGFADYTQYKYGYEAIPLNLTAESIEILNSLPADGYYVKAYYIVRATFQRGITVTSRGIGPATCELIKSAPTMTPEVIDINTNTIALTGSNKKLVRFKSMAKYTINGSAGDSATIKEQYVICNGVKYYGATGNIDGVEVGKFTFYLENSRGLNITQQLELEIVPYVRLTCNKVYVNPPDNETGDINFKVKGNCYKGSFGVAENTLTIQYRFKESEADNFTAWYDVPAANVHHYDGPVNTWDATGVIEALDYRKTYQVQFRAVDSLSTATTAIIRATSIPVFDWSKDDFNINVPTTIEGKVFGKNVILWHSSSGSQMTSTHTAYLTQPIQDQAHGIVLVFSAAGDNVSWSTHFVPKAMLEYNDGGGQLFLMGNNAELSAIGAKYLYIYDDMIKGHSSNNTVASGYANSGIKFDNSKFVLRYVIGV